MTDIVERLRLGAGHEPAEIISAERIMDEAADEIARLRADGEQLAAKWTSTHTRLTAEFEKLRADNERLRALGPDDDWEERGAAGELRAEIERLQAHVESMINAMKADNERLTALLREAVLYNSQIIHMESWWRKVRRALEPNP